MFKWLHRWVSDISGSFRITFWSIIRIFLFWKSVKRQCVFLLRNIRRKTLSSVRTSARELSVCVRVCVRKERGVNGGDVWKKRWWLSPEDSRWLRKACSVYSTVISTPAPPVTSAGDLIKEERCFSLISLYTQQEIFLTALISVSKSVSLSMTFISVNMKSIHITPD